MGEGSEKETTLEAHLQFAVRAIEEDQHLRVLVRHFLSMTQAVPPSSVFTTDPIQSAYNQGYQAAGLELASILTSVAPRLVPTLLLEELSKDEHDAQED